MKSLKLLLPIIGLVFLASSEGNAGIFGSKSAPKAAPAATQEFQITENVSVEVSPKSVKALDMVHTEYDLYAQLKATGSKLQQSKQLVKLDKACKSKCTAGVMGVGGICKDPGSCEACLAMCGAKDTKNCAKAGKMTQGTVLKNHALKLDSNGIPIDNQSILSKAEASTALVQSKAGNRNAKSSKAIAKKQVMPVEEEEEPLLDEEDADIDDVD